MATKTYEELLSEVMVLREMNARLREENERQRREIEALRRGDDDDGTRAKARLVWVLTGREA